MHRYEANNQYPVLRTRTQVPLAKTPIARWPVGSRPSDRDGSLNGAGCDGGAGQGYKDAAACPYRRSPGAPGPACTRRGIPGQCVRSTRGWVPRSRSTSKQDAARAVARRVGLVETFCSLLSLSSSHPAPEQDWQTGLWQWVTGCTQPDNSLQYFLRLQYSWRRCAVVKNSITTSVGPLFHPTPVARVCPPCTATWLAAIG